MEKLFLQVFDMSVTASYVILFVLVARILLKRTPKIFSYALWAIVGFRLLFPFSFESAWSLLPTQIKPVTETPVIEGTPITPTAITDNSNIHYVESLLPTATIGASVDPIQIVIFVCSWIWAMGFIGLMIYSFVSMFRLKQKLKHATHFQENIYIANGLKTPFVLGFFHPKIYLPAGLYVKEREYILLHEQTHIRRGDHIIKIFAFFLVCLHWMNPLVWIAFIYMSRDMEMSCDESVLKKLGYKVKQSYSTSLLSLATGRNFLKGSPLAFGGEGDVKGRIKNVLSYKKPTLWVGMTGTIIVIVLAIGLLANPSQMKGVLILEVNESTISEKQFSAYHVSARALSNGVKLVFGMDEMKKITNLQAFIQELRVIEKEISISRAEDRAKNHQLIFYKGTEDVFLSFNFNADYSEIWIDNALKPSFTYQVVDPDRAKKFFETQFTNQIKSNEWAEKLLSYQTKYVGDASKVGNILYRLKLPADLYIKNGFELQTSKEPYEITIPFTVNTESLKNYRLEENQNILREKAYIFFALIDNVGVVNMKLSDGNEEIFIKVTREEANTAKGEDVRNFTKSIEKFRDFVHATLVRTSPEVQRPMIYFQNVLEWLKDLQKYPQTYTPEQATQDGWFTYVHGNYTNQTVMNDFIQSAQVGKPTQVKIIQYTTEGDPILTVVVFDGKQFEIISDMSRDKFGGGTYTQQYSYLHVLESADKKQTQAVLTNEKQITYQELTKKLLSSVTPFEGYMLYSYEK